MAATKKAKLASGWAYFIQQPDSKWKRVSKAEYDAAQHDHRTNPGAWSRPSGRATPPARGPGGGPRSRTVGPAPDDDYDDGSDDDGSSDDDPYNDLQEAYSAAYGDGFVSGFDYIGDDDAVLTPQQEQYLQTAAYEKEMRELQKKSSADKMKKAATYATNPAAAVWDGIKATADKVAETTTAKAKQSVVNAEAADWLPIIAVVGILILGSKRKR